MLDEAAGVTFTTTGDDAVLTVDWTLERIELLPTTATRGRGESIRLRATGHFAGGFTRSIAERIVYTSSDDTVALPTNAAAAADHSRILAAGEGATTISVFDAQDGVSSTTTGDDATFVVSGILARLTLGAEKTQLTVGESIQLTATGHLVGGATINLTQQVEYAASDPAVVKAENPPGDRSRILTLAPGTAVISARDPGTGIVTAPGGTLALTVVAPRGPPCAARSSWRSDSCSATARQGDLQSDPSLTYPTRSLHETLNAKRARATMKFGLFFEIPVARPWTAHRELDAYQSTLAQAILADEVDPPHGRAGVAGVWLSIIGRNSA